LKPIPQLFVYWHTHHVCQVSSESENNVGGVAIWKVWWHTDI